MAKVMLFLLVGAWGASHERRRTLTKWRGRAKGTTMNESITPQRSFQISRMMAALAVLAVLIGVQPVLGQLIRQEVRGVWRTCVYSTPRRMGSSRPGQALGSFQEQEVRIGRGEPCPARRPSQRPPNRRIDQATDELRDG